MPRGPTLVVVSLMALGTGLRTTQFAAGTSLWHDELRIALNLEARSLLSLLSAPLDFLQIVPPAFLIVSWLAAHLPVAEELGLRLLPWISPLVSLLLFWKIAIRGLPPAAAAAALVPFAVSPALVWHGGNAKPYAGDVAATLLLVWLVFRFDDDPNDRAIVRLGGAGSVLSQPSIRLGSRL